MVMSISFDYEVELVLAVLFVVLGCAATTCVLVAATAVVAVAVLTS